jgi:hypothetical protein
LRLIDQSTGFSVALVDKHSVDSTVKSSEIHTADDTENPDFSRVIRGGNEKPNNRMLHSSSHVPL